MLSGTSACEEIVQHVVTVNQGTPNGNCLKEFYMTMLRHFPKKTANRRISAIAENGANNPKNILNDLNRTVCCVCLVVCCVACVKFCLFVLRVLCCVAYVNFTSCVC